MLVKFLTKHAVNFVHFLAMKLSFLKAIMGRRSVELIFAKLINVVSLEQFNQKPIGMYYPPGIFETVVR